MGRVFEFHDYREFLHHYLRSLPKRGHGQLRVWAEKLRLHTSHISQVMKGDRDFSEVQGLELAEFLGLTELEEEYFLGLIRLTRAGNKKLRARIESQLRRLSDRSARIQEHLPKQPRVLKESDAALFYSEWLYSAVRLLSSIPGCQTIEAIAHHLGEPVERISPIVDFLVSRDLCKSEGGQIGMGPFRTHLPPESPLIRRLHSNWRLRSLRAIERSAPSDLHFTCPMTLSEKDASKIRSHLVNEIGTIQKWIETSNSEKLVCLNIDLFGVAP